VIGLAGIFQGICNFGFRQMSVATSSVYALAAFFVVSGVMFLGYAAAVRDGDIPRAAWGWIGLMCVTIFLSNVLLMKGFSGSAPVGAGYLVFYVTSLAMVVGAGVLLLGEKLNVYGWVGAFLAVAAIVLLANGRG
jgi:drug/metabolite transporter (DMT)-like permease